MIDSGGILEINTKNILHNYKTLSKIAINSIAGATIKANAYGLGDIKVFNIFQPFLAFHYKGAVIQTSFFLVMKGTILFFYEAAWLQTEPNKFCIRLKAGWSSL